MTNKALQELLHKRKEATRLIDQGKHERAVLYLKKCYQKFPDHPVFLTDLASTYAKLFDYEQAIQSIDTLLQKFGNDVNVVRFSGDLYASMRRPDEALKTFQILADLSPNAEEKLRLVKLSEMQGELVFAEECLEEAIQQEPNSEEARFLQALIQSRNKQPEQAAENLFNLFSSGINNREVHWKAGHLLAKILDQSGNHTDATQVLLATKQGMENNYASEIHAARNAFKIKCESIKQLSRAIKKDDIIKWREQAPTPPAKMALLAGHPRSGTTLLESILERRTLLTSIEETSAMEDQVFRAVYGIPIAKPQLFERGFLNQIPQDTLIHANDLYHRALQQISPIDLTNRPVMDKNPMLTHFMILVQRFFPSMKNIIALRDPRAVCLSCFQQSVGVNTSNVSWLNMEDTVNAYHNIMDVWLRLRDLLPDGWLEVRYEDLVNKTETTAKKVSAFLGLEWHHDEHDDSSRKRMVYSPTYAEVSQPIYHSALRNWENYETLIQPHIKTLQPFIHAFGYEV